MLEVRHLSKSFSRKAPAALSDVSFTVERGQICGLLGHNGAGKSTALGVMLGMVYPDEGEVIIDQCSVQQEREKAMRKVGAIFEAPSFYEYLTGWKNLKILTAYSGGVSTDKIAEVVEWVGLSERIHHRVGTYSHGMRQRLALAQALLPGPEFLLLDEPTDGLDPEGIVEFRSRILELRDRLNITVLLSSHLLGEVAQVCDKVVILRKGKLVFDGPVNQIADQRAIYRVKAEDVTLEEIVAAAADFDATLVPGGEISFPSEVRPDELLTFLVGRKQFRISEFTPKSDSLEAMYMELSQKEEEAPR
ncbi:MAG: ABC transporter ATP-binding protein [Verrucomicrobiales bacterium]|nr:ABC transporter ATP-binding protein [Verrucomicrobiales bacterium]